MPRTNQTSPKPKQAIKAEGRIAVNVAPIDFRLRINGQEFVLNENQMDELVDRCQELLEAAAVLS